MFGSRRTLWILFALLLIGLGACVADDPVGLGNDPAGTEPAPEEIGRDDVPVPGAISPAPEILPAQSVPTPGEPSGLDIGGGTPLANRQAGAPSWVGDSEADSGLPIAVDSPEPGSSAYGTGGIDILFRNEATGENGVWKMDGTNMIGFSRVTSASTAWDLGGVADFDADGQADIVWRNPTTGQDGLWLMQGVDFGSYVSLTPVSNLDYRIVGAGDFTGDDKPDLLWRNTSNGDVAIWEMNGGQFVAYHKVGRTSTDWTIGGVGDFNGDGNNDIVFRNQVTGANGLWLLSGTAFSGYQGLPRVADLTWMIGGVGDLTGDDAPDLLWQRSTGTVAAWEMSGATFVGYHKVGTLSDLAWQVAGLADFDNIGRAGWEMVSTGMAHTCALDTRGQAYCWGLRRGSVEEEDNRPVPVSGGLTFAMLDAGLSTCGVTTSGELYCWGPNNFGELGNGTSEPSSVPVRVPAPAVSWRQVKVSESHACAITTQNDLYCWGRNDSSQLGSGRTEDEIPTPQRVEVLLDVAGDTIGLISGFVQDVEVTHLRTCAIIGGEGYLGCWGTNGEGEATLGFRSTPVRRPTAKYSGVTTPALGRWYFTCALSGNPGPAFCWGMNGDGQAGDGTDPPWLPHLDPSLVVGGHTWKSLDAGWRHICGLTTGGKPYCWGLNLAGLNGGALGTGSTDFGASSTPLAVATNETFVQISAGGPNNSPYNYSPIPGAHTCGVTDQGELFCWGLNTYGQLGDGSKTEKAVPTRVLDP